MSMTIATWKANVRGKALWEFIVFRQRRESGAITEGSLISFIRSLPPTAVARFDSYLDATATSARNPLFWRQDCAAFMDRILADVKAMAPTPELAEDDQFLFDAFEAVSSRLVLEVSERGAARAALDAAAPRVLTASTFFLLIPLAMTWQASRASGGEAPAVFLVGYGVAQVGYLLLAAGVVAGTFLTFGLHTRKQTILTGLVLLALGTVIVNA